MIKKTNNTQGVLTMATFEYDKQRIGKLIERIRGDLSLEKFGDIIGVSKVSVFNYESGKIIPSKKVSQEIRAFDHDKNNQPLITNNEFLYGTPKEYFKHIFASVPQLHRTENNPVFKAFQVAFGKTLQYGDEERIISFALEQDPTLKQDANFLRLCQNYGIDSLQYAIEDNEQYQTDLLPMLDKKASQLQNISKYTDLLSHLLDSFIINDEAENSIGRPSVPLRRRSHINLENYFDKAYLKTLTDFEKYELEGKLEAIGASMYKFFDCFNDIFPFTIDTLYKDYDIENKAIEAYLKASGNDPSDHAAIQAYKEQWWQ